MDADPEITLLSEDSTPDQSSSPNSVPPRPRLRSPHLFRDIFADNNTPGTRSEVQLPPVNYQETLQDVRSALQNADMAVRNAQEAFMTGRTNSSRRSVVDLTSSPPRIANEDTFMSRTLHPHDSTRGMSAIRNATNSLHEPIYGSQHFSGASLDSANETNANSHDTFSSEVNNDLPQQFLANFHFPLLLNPPLPPDFRYARSSEQNRRQEEAAVRRQRQARRDWERVQRHIAQRREVSRQRQQEAQAVPLPPSPELTQLQTNNDGIASQPLTTGNRSQNEAGGSEMSPVDLTQVEDDTSLAEALAKQRQDAVLSQLKESTGDSRTAFSAFKCTICMEPPTDATTTICGHLFCHQCIIDSLKWSEQLRREEQGRSAKGLCPVCRKPLTTKDTEGPNRGLVPLEIKLVSKKAFQQWKEDAKGKGKEKVETQDIDIDLVLPETMDDTKGGGKGKFAEDSQRKRKREVTDEDLFGEFIQDEQL